MSERLPEKFLAEGLELAKGVTFFGHDLNSFSRDELLALAAQGWKAEQRAREREFQPLRIPETQRSVPAIAEFSKCVCGAVFEPNVMHHIQYRSGVTAEGVEFIDCAHGKRTVRSIPGSLIVEDAERAKAGLPFVHWSKDPLVPYPGCACKTCSSLDNLAASPADQNQLDPENRYFWMCMKGHVPYSVSFSECPSCKIAHHRDEVMNPPVPAAQGTEARNLNMPQRHGLGASPQGSEAQATQHSAAPETLPPFQTRATPSGRGPEGFRERTATGYIDANGAAWYQDIPNGKPGLGICPTCRRDPAPDGGCSSRGCPFG